MKMKHALIGFFVTGALTICGQSAYAQSYAESALLFSRTPASGSARVQGFGGAQVAIGGDYSTSLSNPAGLGVYNKSELTIGLGFHDQSTTSNGNGVLMKDGVSKFNIPNFSYISHAPSNNDSYYGGSFGISYTRTNDFNRNTIYSNLNTQNSIVDFFLNDATGVNPNALESESTVTSLGYTNYLIDADQDYNYFSNVPIGAPGIRQLETFMAQGRAQQWSFSYGGNVKDLFFFGVGIGVPSLRYQNAKTYEEHFRDNSIINSILLTESLDISGQGINATLGFIVRPKEFLQVGLSYITPTVYNITETYNAALSTDWNNYEYSAGKFLNNVSDRLDEILSEYSLKTPGKLNLGATFLSEYGFITGDIEITNPDNAKYSSNISGINFKNENQEISTLFKRTINYRVGAEGRYKLFRIRAGYNFMADPYASSNQKSIVHAFSGGVGVRFEKYFIDVAVTKRHWNSVESPYTLDHNQPIINQRNHVISGILSVGYRF
jgi:hypothetical protein